MHARSAFMFNCLAVPFVGGGEYAWADPEGGTGGPDPP